MTGFNFQDYKFIIFNALAGSEVQGKNAPYALTPPSRGGGWSVGFSQWDFSKRYENLGVDQYGAVRQYLTDLTSYVNQAIAWAQINQPNLLQGVRTASLLTNLKATSTSSLNTQEINFLNSFNSSNAGMAVINRNKWQE